MEKIYRLNNLDCAGCASKLEDKIGKIKGINEVNINFMNKKMIIDSNNTDIEEIKKTIHSLEPDIEIEEL